MNTAEEKRNARIAAMSDKELLFHVVTVCDDQIGDSERNAFISWRPKVESGGRLTKRERKWAEEAARKVMPYDSRDAPRGREVATPKVLKDLPKKPPPRRHHDE